jgi:hypothetical protein
MMFKTIDTNAHHKTQMTDGSRGLYTLMIPVRIPSRSWYSEAAFFFQNMVKGLGLNEGDGICVTMRCPPSINS